MAAILLLLFLLVLFYIVCPDYLQAFSSKVTTWWSGDKALHAEKHEQIKTLKTELSTINMSDEFARYAKCERKINKLKEELKKLSRSRNELFVKVKMAVTVSFRASQVWVFLGLIWKLRYEPLIVLPVEWVWPLSNLIAFPTGVPGAVGITWWIIVCRSVITRAKEYVDSLKKLDQLDEYADYPVDDEVVPNNGGFLPKNGDGSPWLRSRTVRESSIDPDRRSLDEMD